MSHSSGGEQVVKRLERVLEEGLERVDTPQAARAVVARIEKIAKVRKITLQHEAMSATSGTDTDAIFWTRGGIASALISLPNRYMHSPVELVSLKDLERIPELLAGFADSLKKDEEFKVRI